MGNILIEQNIYSNHSKKNYFCQVLHCCKAAFGLPIGLLPKQI